MQENTKMLHRKQNSNYWETGIKDTRSKRVQISCEEVDNQEPLDFDVDTLSAQEIKEMLKERGVKTRFRCLKKLKKNNSLNLSKIRKMSHQNHSNE